MEVNLYMVPLKYINIPLFHSYCEHDKDIQLQIDYCKNI